MRIILQHKYVGNLIHVYTNKEVLIDEINKKYYYMNDYESMLNYQQEWVNFTKKYLDLDLWSIDNLVSYFMSDYEIVKGGNN